MLIKSLSSRLHAWLLPVMLGGCLGTHPPTDYFLLETLALPRASAQAGSPAPVVGVGPIRFPRYLDRPQIVMAMSGGQLRLLDNQRWADNLRDNFSRVFAENLAAQVPTERVLVHPWSRSDTVDFKLTLRVNEFHLTESGAALLDARWDLYRTDRLVSSHKSHLRTQAANSTPAAGVQALSRAVAALSRECAQAIRRSGVPARGHDG